MKVKVAGAWVGAIPHVKVADNWVPVKKGYTKVAGNWKQVYPFPGTGIVNWWLLENDLLDSIGAKHGTGAGSLSYADVNGRRGIRFNGSSYVALPTLTSFSNGTWTVCTWYYPVALTMYSHLLTALTQSDNAFKIAPSNAGSISARPYHHVGGVSRIGDVALALNSWHHIAFTFDGSSLKIYVNKVLVGQYSNLSISIGDFAYRIGNGNSTEYSNGYQNDLRVYNRALTALEIANIVDGYA